MLSPRAPTPDELRIIVYCICDEHDPEFQETKDALDQAAVAVFDGYISDGPGYAGRVATVVWPGGPELFDVFILDGPQPATMSHDPCKVQLERLEDEIRGPE